jgi:hypothetical protein
MLGSDGRPTLLSEWVHVSLSAAVTSAKRMSNGAAFEIWTGGARVYAGKHPASRVLSKPDPKAA